MVDYSTYIDINGNTKFEFLVIDSSKNILNKTTKWYTYTKLYTIYGLDSEGYFYEATIPQNAYGNFDFKHPTATNTVIKFYQPTWTGMLDFIPVVAINKLDCQIKFNESFIQDLINTSLHNYRLSCNLGWLEQNSASSHLVIKGENLDDVDSYPTGAGAIHVLNDPNANEFYVTPSTAGITEIKEHINQNNELLNAMQYSLLNASANSSGEALQFRISVKCSDLVNLVKTVGKGITLALEFIDTIVNDGKNKDNITYLPYIGFDKVNSYLDNINEEEHAEEIESDINNERTQNVSE